MRNSTGGLHARIANRQEKQPSFTDQRPHMTTASQAALRHWRCNFCGHRFLEDETFRWIYGNCRTVVIDGKKGGLSNFLVCAKCDDLDEKLRDREVAFLEVHGWRFLDE